MRIFKRILGIFILIAVILAAGFIKGFTFIMFITFFLFLFAVIGIAFLLTWLFTSD